MPKSFSNNEPEWQYRTPKILDRCKLKYDTVQSILNRKFEFEEPSKQITGNDIGDSDSDSSPFSNLLFNDGKQESCSDEMYEDSDFKESEGGKDENPIRVTGWNNDQDCSNNDGSLHSTFYC